MGFDHRRVVLVTGGKAVGSEKLLQLGLDALRTGNRSSNAGFIGVVDRFELPSKFKAFIRWCQDMMFLIDYRMMVEFHCFGQLFKFDPSIPYY